MGYAAARIIAPNYRPLLCLVQEDEEEGLSLSSIEAASSSLRSLSLSSSSSSCSLLPFQFVPSSPLPPPSVADLTRVSQVNFSSLSLDPVPDSFLSPSLLSRLYPRPSMN